MSTSVSRLAPALCLLLAMGTGAARAQRPDTTRHHIGQPDSARLIVPTLDSLSRAVQARIASSGASVGFYFRDLVRSDSLAFGADDRFHAASTMKVPVMIQVFRDADARLLGLHDRLVVSNEFRSLADSSPFQLDRKDDSDSSLYGRVGQPVEITQLLELMITRSSNLATNNLIERVGAARVQATLNELHADSVRVLRGVEDGVAFRAGINNTTTARGLGQVMASIAGGNAASTLSCGEMIRILMRQKFNEGIPAGLPPRMRVAHKTGEITAGHHDAAIVYYENRPRYVLVILTRGLQQRTQSAKLMADLAALVNAYAVPEATRPRGFLSNVL